MNLEQLLAKAEPKLSLIHPELRLKARELITRAFNMGIYVVITQGLRTIAEQNALYAQGRTAPGEIVTNAVGGSSYHNFGLAFDFAIANSNGSVIYWDTNVDTNKDRQKDWYQVGKIGQDLKMEWGGAWSGFRDIPHFQLTYGLSCADLRNGKKPPVFKAAVEEKKESVRMYKPSRVFLDDTKTVLARFENKGVKSIDKVHREKLNNGELSLDDAVGLLFHAIKEEMIQGSKK